MEMNTLVLIRYLRDITEKLVQLDEKVDTLAKKVMMLGAANSEAYNRTKEVISELADNQKSVELDLSDAMGTVRESTWC